MRYARGVRKPHSPRFVRLGAAQVDALFGAGARLSPRIEISGGRFVARERVSVVGMAGRLDGVAVVGPIEERAVVRLGPGDLQRLGLDGGGGLLLVGPHGEVRITDNIEASP
jgi:propanediol utilization protein